MSPLLANVALSMLDEHIAHAPGGPAATPYQRAKRRRNGLPNYRLVRYADDWVLAVSGTRAHAEALREEIAEVLSRMGLRLSPDKTLITHVDEGLDFLGWRIQRHRKRGTNRRYVYTCPTKKALRPAMATVQTLCRQVGTNNPLDALLLRLNPALRGWCAYFRPGVSAATFGYLGHYAGWQVGRWLRRKHARITWKELRRRHCGSGWWPASPERQLFNPATVHTTRYQYRGAVIPSPGRPRPKDLTPTRDVWRARCTETCTPGSGGGPGKRTGRKTGTPPRADLTIDPLTARRFQYLSQHSCYMTGCGYGTRGRKRQLAVADAYWQLIMAGVGTVEACQRVGITRKTGYRWRAKAGSAAAEGCRGGTRAAVFVFARASADRDAATDRPRGSGDRPRTRSLPIDSLAGTAT
jgi:hypothetical protein